MTLAPTVDDRALAFVAELVLPNGQRIGDSFATDPWLRDDILSPLLAKRPDGLPEHRFFYFEGPKGTGKSTVGGGALLVECIAYPGTHAFIVATDVEQGRIIVEILGTLVSRFSRLKAAVRHTGNEFRFSNGSFVRVLSSDVPSSHGLGATARRLRFLLDEWTQHLTPGMYHSMLSTMTKVPDSAMWIFCNAGVAASWQQEAREQLAASAHMFITPEGWLPSWVRRADVEALKDKLPLPLWERYFLNRWVAETGEAITAAEWDACRADIPPLDAATPLVAAVDAAISGDSFAIVAVSRAQPPADALPEHYRSETDGPRLRLIDTGQGFDYVASPTADAEKPEVWVRAVRIWRPERGNIDFAVPYAYLSDFIRGHNVATCAYDPYQLHHWASQLRLDSGCWLQAYDQGSRRAQADTDLLQLIRARRLRHDGDPALREHALNTAIKISPREDTRARFVKAHPNKKIDAAVALSMAASECLRLNL